MDTTSTGTVPAPRAPDGGVRRPRVVVGVDGSPGSRLALCHALTAAARRHADLDVVAAYAVELYYLGGAPLAVPDLAVVREDTYDRVSDLIEEVRHGPDVTSVPGAADVSIELVVPEGPAVQALVDRAEGAELLVVGSRGRGAMRSALLGSVALHCVTHAPCPVVVVHPLPADLDVSARVVVGVDGSPGSRAALAAALDEAGRIGARVDALATYLMANYWVDAASVVVPSRDQVRADLRGRTQQLVDEVLAERPARPVASPPVRVEVIEGPPAEVLVERARGAAMLAVGSRGRGALRGLLLGSVALHCAMHAPCPVLVVHPQPGRAKDAAAQRAPEPAESS